MDRTLALLGRAHQGDKEARDTLFEENVGLIWSVVKRFTGRGADMEDLFQVGSIGLLKAVDNFDFSYDVKFSTYAVPMITGEVKRFLRDDGMLKVSRGLKETAVKAFLMKDMLEKQLGREVGLAEVADAIQLPVEELVLAMEAGAEVESLYKTVYQGDGSEISLMDRIPEKKNPQERLLNRIFLEEALSRLKGRERKLIYLRYFQELTQTEVARELGISQVQVSRIEKKVLESIREMAK
ncbi:MAG: SigF/SigG family RNA polymerase sporulation sigma factor [Eubacteriales bacterium]|nr:SigF/SigG family RNA polymerase sporulation sigma factor [Eubacteriales bacterium]